MSDRGITVVVPTYNCRDLLVMTLNSLCEQKLSRDLFEVLVVDDGSSDGTVDAVSDYINIINIRYFFQEDLGFRVAAARNVGIREASFGVILFIDSGIIISSNLLKIHYLEHAKNISLAVIGMSYGVREYDSKNSEIIKDLIEGDVDKSLAKLGCHAELKDCREVYIESINYDLINMPCPWLIFWGGHVSVSKSVLLRLGGFDENFRCWGGEDVELGLRLYKEGCEFRILKGIESAHYPHEKDPDQRKADSRINISYIHKKHGLRETEMLISMNWEEIVDRVVESPRVP